MTLPAVQVAEIIANFLQVVCAQIVVIVQRVVEGRTGSTLNKSNVFDTTGFIINAQEFVVYIVISKYRERNYKNLIKI